jgi:hypothetical protein
MLHTESNRVGYFGFNSDMRRGKLVNDIFSFIYFLALSQAIEVLSLIFLTQSSLSKKFSSVE